MTPDHFFTAQARPMYIAGASGYLHPGGGLCDAAGSLVLHYPTRERVRVIVGHSAHAAVRLYAARTQELVEIPLSLLQHGGGLLRADELYPRLTTATDAAWALPLVGACTELWRMLYRDGQGVEIYLEDELPPGIFAGAALLIAVLEALCELYETHMSGIALPLIAQRAVRRVARRPLPLPPLLTPYFGRQGHLLPVRSRQTKTARRIGGAVLPGNVGAGEVHEATALPDDAYLLGCAIEGVASWPVNDRLETAGSMAYSVIAARQGATRAMLDRARRDGRYGELPYAGFLGTVDYAWMYRDYARLLPETLRGADFLARYGEPIDPFVRVDPAADYPLRAAGLLPIRTNFENQQLLDALTQVQGGQLHPEEWTRQLGARMRSAYQIQLAFERIPPAVRALHDLLDHDALDERRYGLVAGPAGSPLLTVLAYGEAAVDTLQQRLDEYREAYGQSVRLLLP